MVVVFCRQKTAYEMRVSDWSSDVCSADLRGLRRGGYVGRQRDQSGQWLAPAQSGGEDDRTALREAGEEDPRNRHAALELARDERFDLSDRLRHAGQIGRAHV